MAKLCLRKLWNSFVPVDEESADAMEKLKPNGEYVAEIRVPRNYKMLQKAHVLVTVVFDMWEVEARQHKGMPVMKNKERLRKDMTILAGYYDTVFKYDGTMVLEAQSWSYAARDEVSFQRLYSGLVDVAIGKVLPHMGLTPEALNRRVDTIINGFG